MLTGALARPRLRVHQGEIQPRLLAVDDAAWLATAAALLQAYEARLGDSAGALEEAVKALCGDRPDFVVLRGLAKVLNDSAEWAQPDSVQPPEELRRLLLPPDRHLRRRPPPSRRRARSGWRRWRRSWAWRRRRWRMGCMRTGRWPAAW